MIEPKPDVHAYLDSNVVRDFGQGLNEEWDPVDDIAHASNQQRINAVRLVFYGYRGRIPPGYDVPWTLVVSTTVRRELERKIGSPDLVTTLFSEVDMTSDAPSNDVLQSAASRLAGLTGITDMDYATHLAHAALRPWVRYLITSDRTFRSRAARVDTSTGGVVGRRGRRTLEHRPRRAPADGAVPRWACR